ncbi:hypothetical protein AAFF_G00274830 [Aldrovandia affinis]|uniref:C3H1-type domain-containing protein n=1 Tax=Aldrovandia affinis TaxID=143900 RepID=A0AAD7SS44_9TELE|nr:hypothetical protein AAFF_G00274830 [Aldrovandia affinis]
MNSHHRILMVHFKRNPALMQFQEAMVDLISGRAARYNTSIDHSGGALFGLDFASVIELDEAFADENSDYGDSRDKKSYCGFTRNFLRQEPPKPPSPQPTHRSHKLRQIMEADRNAQELVEEEERLKKKAEKKKLKKSRQKARKRQEKEKDTLIKNKDGSSPEAEDSVTKSKFSNSEIASNKSDGCTPPDAGRVKATASSAPIKNNANSNEPCEDEDDDDEEEEDESASEEESIVSEPELLDMNSCFVSKAATIERQEQQQQRQQQQNAVLPSVEDVVKRSMELAVIGNQLAAAGQFDMAVTYFTDAIKHNPKEFRLFGNRSFCYEKMLQYDKSLIDADITLAMSPGWIKGLYRRGRALAGLKRYCEAVLAFREVLKHDPTCSDAAQELMRVQIMQLMDMGFSREQSSNALIIHGTVEKALQAFSNIQDEQFGGSSNLPAANASQSAEQEWAVAGQKAPSPESLTTQLAKSQYIPVYTNPANSQADVELFPCQVCVCEAAINTLDGRNYEGTVLSVRCSDRVPSNMGAANPTQKIIEPDPYKPNSKKYKECFFWRMGGCIRMEKCNFKHIPNHRGIDRGKDKHAPWIAPPGSAD